MPEKLITASATVLNKNFLMISIGLEIIGKIAGRTTGAGFSAGFYSTGNLLLVNPPKSEVKLTTDLPDLS